MNDHPVNLFLDTNSKANRDVSRVRGVLELEGALEVCDHLEAAHVDPAHSLGADGALHHRDDVHRVEAEGYDQVRL